MLHGWGKENAYRMSAGKRENPRPNEKSWYRRLSKKKKCVAERMANPVTARNWLSRMLYKIHTTRRIHLGVAYEELNNSSWSAGWFAE
jgi:hypothetical protein